MPGRTWPTLTAAQRNELRELHAVARRCSGTMPPEHPDRRVSEAFTALLARLHLEDRIPRTELARALGLRRPNTIRDRLVRHGYLDPQPHEKVRMVAPGRRYLNQQVPYGRRPSDRGGVR